MKLLGAIIGLIPQRSPNPIFTYLRYRREGEGLRVWVDGDVEATALLPLPVEGEGEGLLPRGVAHYLEEAARILLRPEEVEMELRGGGTVRARVAPAEGWPTWPDQEPVVRVRLGREAWGTVTRLEAFASREEYRAIFRGVQLEAHPDRLRAVASDGYRLAMVDLPASVEGTGKAVVGRAALAALGRLVRAVEGNEHVRLAWSGGTLHLALGPLEARAALMEGEFPDYERVIPKEAPIGVELRAGEVAGLLARAEVLTEGQNRRVDLVWRGGGWGLEAEGDLGHGHWPFPARLVQGEVPEGGRWAFNARYLREALEFLGGDVEGHLIPEGPGGPPPTVWRGHIGEGLATCVVVPLRI